LEEDFSFTLPSDKDFTEICSALDTFKADGTLATAGESPLGAAATRWPMLPLDPSSRQHSDGSLHGPCRAPATTPVDQSPTAFFARRVSLLAPNLVWSSWRARDPVPEGEIGRALLDMLGLWSASGSKPYEVKVRWTEIVDSAAGD
jgi:hypothetical protein